MTSGSSRSPSSRYPLFERNFTLQARSRHQEWEGPGPLSIKTFSGGRAFYRAGRGFYAVEARRYLLLNENESYAISIDAAEPVSSFCVFFRAGFAANVIREASAGTNKLLDDPGAGQAAEPEFVQMTYTPTATIEAVLQVLRHTAELQDNLAQETHYHVLMRELLCEQGRVHRQSLQLPALRASTRQELMKRVAIAYDYVETCYDREITLDGLAALACLSVRHLLTAYRSVYHTTPYRHLTDRRIVQARIWLRDPNRPVTDIALSLQFEEVSSFNKRFKQRVGCSPTAFRHLCQNGQARELPPPL